MKNEKTKQFHIYLIERKYQKECDKYVIRSINHDMNFQEVCKSTLSAFDEKRRYSNEIECIL